jgi:cell division protein FtsB
MAQNLANPNILVQTGPLAWLAAIALGFYIVFAPSGYLDFRETQRERRALDLKIAELEAENRRLEGEIERIANDRDYLERIAREKLGMVFPDERLVIMPATKP